MTDTTASKPDLLRRRWLFIGAVVLQMALAIASIATMSSVRALVGGESLWSKGFFSALTHLHRFAESGVPQDYREFLKALALPSGMGQAREILDRGADDREGIRQGLLQGENHPSDIAPLLYLMPWAWEMDALQETLDKWRRGDAHIAHLQKLGEEIAAYWQTGQRISAQDVERWQNQITRLSTTVMPLTKEFSASLGARSRDLGYFLISINLLTALLLILMYWITVQRVAAHSERTSLELEEERQRSSVTLAALGDGVLSLDAQLRVRYANPAASKLLDLSIDQLLGRDVQQILPFTQDMLRAQSQAPSATEHYQPVHDTQVHWLQRGDDEPVAVRLTLTQLANAERGTVLVLHDVSQEQNYMRMLVWQQNHDLLTGLDNRPAFEKYLGQIVGKYQSSLLHLNLDHFKMINASYGHAAGDEILRQVCEQLSLTLRESDVLARIGGDEFAVLLSHCPPHAAMQTAERLRKCVHELKIAWRNHNLQTGVSIGVVHVDPSRHNAPQDLMNMAESACKHAKDTGRNRITVYDPLNRVFQRYQGDMEWVQRLRTSLEKNKFVLYAQTVYPLKSSTIGNGGVHFEVLLRLHDRPGVAISPADFIPIAERYDLMTQIDRWVVRNTLRLLKAQLSQGVQISTCAINLSGTSLGDSELLDFIRRSIAEYGIAADKLCFEITETSAIASMDYAISMIEELRKLGCRFSLDDFGSGMASFKYLQQLPVDYLKIDGSFVQDMLKNQSNYAMVEAINHIGHVMGKKTVAEFVGDRATFDALQAMGVDFAQGYFIGQPAPLDDEYFAYAAMPPPQKSRSTVIKA
ncbi:MAG: putative bifunctional diguanylate cyclase/phosphodiesterase [Comamonas sp.]